MPPTMLPLPSQVPILLLGMKCVSRTAIFELASQRQGSNLGGPTGSNCTFALPTWRCRTHNENRDMQFTRRLEHDKKTVNKGERTFGILLKRDGHIWKYVERC